MTEKNQKNKFDKRKKPRREAKDEFEQRILDVARVTRVMAGGKRMTFRVCVVIGDKKGAVAVGIGKGADVTIAVNKAVNKAKKNLIKVPIVNETIPHEVRHKFGAARLLFKPASKGKGVIAGGVIRPILDLAGIKNATSKILGTNNKINNAQCAILALSSLKRKERPEKPEDTKKTEKKLDKNEKKIDNDNNKNK